MYISIFLLPALAATCLGAAIPQVFVTGTTLPVPPKETDTFILGGRAETTFTFTTPSIGLIGASQSVGFNDGTTRSGTLLPRVPQTLGSPSRTAIVTPTPPSSSVKTVKTTTTSKTSSSTKKTSTSSKSSSTSSKKSTSTTSCPPSLSVTLDARQTLSSASRTVPEWPWAGWPTHPVSTVTVTVTLPYTTPVTSTSQDTTRYTSTGDGSTRTASTTLVVPVEKRQSLGSPTRSVLERPWPTFPSISIKTVTVTVTVSSSYSTPPGTTRSTSTGAGSTTTVSTLTAPINKRQVLGSPTRTVLASPPPPPPTTCSSHSKTKTPSSTSLRTPYTGTLPIPKNKRQGLGSPTRTVIVPTTITSSVYEYITTTVTSIEYDTTTDLISTTDYETVTSDITSDIYFTTTKISTLNFNITKTETIVSTTTDTVVSITTDYEYPTTTPASYTSPGGAARTASTTLVVPINKRQQLGGGTPSYSLSWDGGGTGVPWQTIVKGKRQNLVPGGATRSFTFDGSVPTSSATLGVFREM